MTHVTCTSGGRRHPAGEAEGAEGAEGAVADVPCLSAYRHLAAIVAGCWQ